MATPSCKAKPSPRIAALTEAFFTALPEGAAAGFWLMNTANTKNGLWAVLATVPAMAVPEFDFTGFSIFKTAGLKEHFYTPSKRPAWFQQAMHIMGPVAYIFSTLQASLAVELEWYQTLLVVLGNYTEQMLRSYYSYDEWALANNSRRFFDHFFMYRMFMLLDMLGIPDAMKHAWTALEGFIHYRGVAEFQAWNAIFKANPLLNHSLALFAGLSQMTFTRAFDVREFYHLMQKFDAIQEQHASTRMKAFSGFFKDLWKNTLANPAAELVLKGKLLSFIKVKMFQILCHCRVKSDTAVEVMLWVEAGLKTYTGLAMGAIGGQTAYRELAKFFDMGEGAEFSYIVFGMIGYAMSNALQAYGKYSSAKPELMQLYLGKGQRWLSEPTLLVSEDAVHGALGSDLELDGYDPIPGGAVETDFTDVDIPADDDIVIVDGKAAVAVGACLALGVNVTLASGLFSGDPLKQIVAALTIADATWGLGKTIVPRAQSAWTSFWDARQTRELPDEAWHSMFGARVF